MNDQDILIKFFYNMLLIRSFENKIFDLAKKGIIRGSIHLCIGEEATAVATCMAIEPQDYILPTHRGHGQELMKGVEPKYLLAEILGKETGICKGRGGTMHIFDKKNNVLGSQGILGAQFPIASGVGLAIKLKKMTDTLVLCFFGDGTTNLGNFYESLNIASIWNLPIIFICNNNLYGMGTNYRDTCDIEIYKKASMFNIASECIDGNDVENIYYRMKEVVQNVKKNSKPAFIELRTYRVTGHSAFDNRPYRTQEEIELWKQRDPLIKIEKKLIKNRVSKDKIDSISKEINYKINEAEKFAMESNFAVSDKFMEIEV
jgi:TPP-dependent pyruvate/acetoin dehydrogenase alpha subunit